MNTFNYTIHKYFVEQATEYAYPLSNFLFHSAGI